MQVVLNNSKLVVKTSVEISPLFTTQTVTMGQYALGDNLNNFWCPSDSANTLAVGKKIYGIRVFPMSAGGTFKVVKAVFANPSSTTYADDADATCEEVAEFTTTKSSGYEDFFFDNPITIHSVNERIGVQENSCLGWSGSQGYQNVVNIRDDTTPLQTRQYQYCKLLTFNLLV